VLAVEFTITQGEDLLVHALDEAVSL
jgi:hypothetical protein